MTRLLGRLAVITALVGGATVLAAAPAAAASVTFTDRCGFVNVRVQDLPSGATRVFRGQFELVPLPGPADVRLKHAGAAAGDQIRVQVPGQPAIIHTYQPPAGCTPPAVTFTVENACNNTVLVHANNAATAPVLFHTVTSDLVHREAPFPAGGSTWPVAVVAGDKMRLLRSAQDPVLGFVNTEWLVHTAAKPAGCIPNSVAAQFTDGCDTVRVDVTSSIAQPQVYHVIRSFGTLDEIGVYGVVRSNAAGAHEVPVRVGDVIGVYLMIGPIVDFAPPGTVRGGLLPITEYTYTGPPSC